MARRIPNSSVPFQATAWTWRHTCTSTNPTLLRPRSDRLPFCLSGACAPCSTPAHKIHSRCTTSIGPIIFLPLPQTQLAQAQKLHAFAASSRRQTNLLTPHTRPCRGVSGSHRPIRIPCFSVLRRRAANKILTAGPGDLAAAVRRQHRPNCDSHVMNLRRGPLSTRRQAH
ncbi:uncharacterized protein BDZ99DRAFT_32973 [Mytilinidion resinicola]|uniref:Uncharacterized protein n=1 Tax=Mytilinidion resinicola TaxID=574789 RepID=A0A6A6YL69_9PEZI|nr:uncharacterized protein BDZ99DRAFT_32973 [Mytilinidion resinicola]KAF2809626.1 hypothetical protein BDZ99DRAFT_32973 [Mytilinidion resinicola]